MCGGRSRGLSLQHWRSARAPWRWNRNRLIDLYSNLEVSRLKKEETIDTVSLDYFVAQNDVGPVDFI